VVEAGGRWFARWYLFSFFVLFNYFGRQKRIGMTGFDVGVGGLVRHEGERIVLEDGVKE